MGKRSLTVRKIREILRLHFTAGLSNRQIGENLKISKTTVQDCKDRFERSGLKRTSAVNLLRSGVGLKIVKDIGGWKDLRVLTERYLPLTTEDLKKNISRVDILMKP